MNAPLSVAEARLWIVIAEVAAEIELLGMRLCRGDCETDEAGLQLQELSQELVAAVTRAAVERAKTVLATASQASTEEGG